MGYQLVQDGVSEGGTYQWVDDEPAPKKDAPPANSLEGALQKYNQSNFNVSAAAKAAIALGAKHGLTEADLMAATPTFADFHKQQFNSGYTEASNYNQIAQSMVQDALKAKGQDPTKAGDANYIAAGAREANQRWQETQKDDDGFGTILKMVIGIAAGAYLGPLAGMLVRSGFTLASGGSLADVIKGGAISMFTSGLGGGGADVGLDDLSSGAAGDWYASAGADAMADAGLGGAASEAIGTGASNVYAQLGGTMNDGSPATVQDFLDSQAGGADNSFDSGAMQRIVDTGPAETGSLLDSVNSFDDGSMQKVVDGGPYTPGFFDQYVKPTLDTANQYKGIIGPLLSGVGLAGAALLNKSALENKAQTDKEMVAARIEGEKDLVKTKTDATNQAAIDARNRIQAGSYYDATVGLAAPGQARPLRRMDGTLVYQPGLISGVMQR